MRDTEPMEKAQYYSELLADDPDMEPLIEAFVVDLNASCAELEAALSSGSIGEIMVLAHRYKGSGGGYGFPVVSSAGAELEATARIQGDVTDAVRKSASRFLAVARGVRAGNPK